MKMRWEEPSIELQTFVPDEYVSACWKVACAVNAANAYDANNNALHREGHCGSATNQWVRDLDNDGRADTMTETGTDGLGKLTCELYADGTYNDQKKRKYSTVYPGNYIYWTTSAGSTVWHHQGKVEGTDSSHPNRS